MASDQVIFQITGDGSPTASHGEESMHHRGGAFGESVQIYGSAIEKGFDTNTCPRILSVGLGLGYNELLVSAIALINRTDDFKLTSFESDADLTESFLNYIYNGRSKYSKFYDLILDRVEDEYGLRADAVTDLLAQSHELGSWNIERTLKTDTIFNCRYDVILYDLYSSKNSSDLWTEDFFDYFLSVASSPKCIFSTYASTGALKRSLKKAEFVLKQRPGFLNKRESILADRKLSSPRNI